MKEREGHTDFSNSHAKNFSILCLVLDIHNTSIICWYKCYMAFKGAALAKCSTLATFRSCNYYSSGSHRPAAKSAAAANIIFLFSRSMQTALPYRQYRAYTEEYHYLFKNKS